MFTDKSRLDDPKNGLLTDDDPQVKAYIEKLKQNNQFGTSRREAIKKLREAGLHIA